MKKEGLVIFMYTIDKLKSMNILLGKDTVDGELASYFINNLNNLSTMTLIEFFKAFGYFL